MHVELKMPFLFRGTTSPLCLLFRAVQLFTTPPTTGAPCIHPFLFFSSSSFASIAEHPTQSTVMEPPLNQLRYPRASVSSVRVVTPTSPDMHHRPFQTARAGTPSRASSRERSAKPSPLLLTTATLPPLSDRAITLDAR